MLFIDQMTAISAMPASSFELFHYLNITSADEGQ